MNTERGITYDDKVSRVCDYIHQNLDEDLSLERLSRVAALSKYHFHRVFSSHTGLSLFRFIQLARLKRASFHLAFKDGVRVIDVALDAGFESPEAFCRAFKRAFGQTPSEFRAAPDWTVWHSRFRAFISPGAKDMHVDIVDFEDAKVAMLEHHGAPERVFDTVSTFITWRQKTGLSPVATNQTYGIPNGDPDAMPPEDFRYKVCGMIDRDEEVDECDLLTDIYLPLK